MDMDLMLKMVGPPFSCFNALLLKSPEKYYVQCSLIKYV